MKASIQSLQAALAPLVGSVRQAESSDSIAGMQPQVVVEPGSEEEVSAVLAFANQEGLKVLVRGGGTQLSVGFPPASGDILLSIAGLNQIIEHAPHDLTVAVQAGLALTDLQTHLASTKQWLALDPELERAATIGGIVATNASGAHRLRFGGVRDQIIGIRVVLPDGTIAKGGGKVVKNVAGYDLPKLFTGSLGTLGVIVAATFRLYPLAQASRTVILTAPDPVSLCGLAVNVIGSILVPTVIDVLGSSGAEKVSTLAVRFEMGEEAAEAQANTLIEMAKGINGLDCTRGAQMLQAEAETHFWSQQASLRAAGETNNTRPALTVKASLLPTEVASWLENLQQSTHDGTLSARWRAHAGHGIVFAQLSGNDDALINAIDTLRQDALRHKGSLIITDVAPELAQRLDVWGPSPALEVMRRIKANFDPNQTLNSGRFIGRI